LLHKPKTSYILKRREYSSAWSQAGLFPMSQAASSRPHIDMYRNNPPCTRPQTMHICMWNHYFRRSFVEVGWQIHHVVWVSTIWPGRERHVVSEATAAKKELMEEVLTVVSCGAASRSGLLPVVWVESVVWTVDMAVVQSTDWRERSQRLHRLSGVGLPFGKEKLRLVSRWTGMACTFTDATMRHASPLPMHRMKQRKCVNLRPVSWLFSNLL
jgi:hypothetical protein